jgi:hypothetical protein
VLLLAWFIGSWLVVFPMYCGDEVAAIVGDIGFDSCKFGYAGEDMPKVVLPSVS